VTCPDSSSPLHQLFHQLDTAFGNLDWWPADNAYEVIVGAVLTQNTAWTNVEIALTNLKSAIELSPQTVVALTRDELERLITPAGFFRQKARYLHGISTYLLDEYAGNVALLCQGPLEEARKRLLKLTGIGPETADSILLYAANRPSFVVDAYTRRILTRLGILQGRESYNTIRLQFMTALPADVGLFNQYHALIVQHAKTYCRKQQPLCLNCPLLTACPHGQQENTKG